MSRKQKNSNPNQIPVLLAVIAFLVRFVYVFNFLEPNSPEYIKWMPERIDDRASAVLEKGEVFYGNAWGPYYLVLAGEYKLLDWLGVDRINGMVVVNILLASIASYFFYKLAGRLIGERTALISTLLLIFYYPIIYFNGLILNENLFLPLLIMAMCWMVPPDKNLIKFAFGSFLLGMTAGIRTSLLPFIPLFLMWLIWYLYRQKTSWRRLANYIVIFGVLLAFPLMAFSFLNQKFSEQHKFQLSGSTGVNMAMTQCRIKKIKYELADGERFWFAPPAYWGTDFEEETSTVAFYDQKYYLVSAINCFLKHPENAFTNFAHIGNLFDSEFYPANAKPVGFDSLINLYKVLSLIFFVLFVLYPLRVSKKKRELYWPFLLLVLSLFVSVYIANPGEERYLVPYVWVFFIFGSMFAAGRSKR